MDYAEYLKLIKKSRIFEEVFNAHPEFFLNESWYSPQLLGDKQVIRYLNFLSCTYNIKSPQGEIVPYIPYSWQIDFHGNSLILKKRDAKNIFIMKSRGISYSYSTMVEAVNILQMYGGTTIPVIAQRLGNAIDLVKIARWIVEHAEIEIPYNKKKVSELEIYTPTGTSTLRAYPSGTVDAPDAIRMIRPVYAVIDEGGVQKQLKQVLESVIGSMQTDETQIVVGGTPKGKTNHYWRMWSGDLKEYKKFYLPAFDTHHLTKEKIETYKPIVWWFSRKKIAGALDLDRDLTEQEYMCSPYSDTTSLIPLIDVENAIDAIVPDEDLTNWYYLMGVDIASLRDYAAIIVVRTNGKFFLEESVQYFQKIKLPELEQEIEDTYLVYDPLECRIDCTGQGLHIYQSLADKYGDTKIIGCNFASSVLINKADKITTTLRKYVFTYLEKVFKKGIIKITDDVMQKKHLCAIPKNLQIKHTEDGHCDIGVGLGLAILPIGFKENGYYPDAADPVNEQLKKQQEIIRDFRKNAFGVKRKEFGGLMFN